MSALLAYVLVGSLGVAAGLGVRRLLRAVAGAGRRHRAEEAARQIRQRFDQALDVALAGTWSWDPVKGTSEWSDEVFRLYSLDPRKVTPTYAAWLDAIHPADRDAAHAAAQAAVRQGTDLQLEWRVNDPQGLERWILLRGRAERDATGVAVRYYGIVCDITQRKVAENALRASEDLYRTVFRTSPDAITINRLSDGRYLDVNDGFCRVFGWEPDAVIGRTSRDIRIWHRIEDRAPFIQTMQRDGHCDNWETTLRGHQGQPIPVMLSSRRIDVRGEPCILTVTRDISASRAADSNLRKLSQALEQSPESIIITNLAGQIEYVNQAFCRNSGYSPQEAIGRTPDFLNAGRGDPAEMARLWDCMKKGLTWQGEFHNRRKDGSEYTDFATIAPIRQADGQMTHFVAVQQDITERVRAERRIQQLAYFDQLTGLPNRTQLFDRLREATAGCARTGGHGVLMMIDLDNFKILNDTLGHDVGDQLLRQVAARVSACLRQGDTVARLGGDEFMVVMTGLDADERAAAAAAQAAGSKILGAFDTAFPLGGGTHNCTGSIGITLFRDERISADELMKQADLAMYKAKEGGRDALRFFDPQMESAVRERSELERDLRRALKERQFELHYQPQVVGQGRIVGAEALVRWRHPQRGLVSPAAFIPVAEDSALIVPLGKEIFAMAFAQLAAWAREPATAGLTLSVNVSARQIRQPDFVSSTLALLRAAGADPARLKLEITESLLIENTEDIIAKMAALKGHGVGFSLDDFGTGFSSLAYLKRLPLDQLKIDQSFVRGVLTDNNAAAIVRTIIALAATMGLSVIAEGVETEDERAFLAGAGCNHFQGYFFDRPLPAAQFMARLLPALASQA